MDSITRLEALRKLLDPGRESWPRRVVRWMARFGDVDGTEDACVSEDWRAQWVGGRGR